MSGFHFHRKEPRKLRAQRFKKLPRLSQEVSGVARDGTSASRDLTAKTTAAIACCVLGVFPVI